MTEFKTARVNMVDSQIHTMGVTDQNILNAYRTVPRELFVPEDRRTVAYSDEDLAIAQGRWLMEPVTHARLVQAALPVVGEHVLDVAGGAGYSAAVLSMLCEGVTAVEPDAALLDMAKAAWLSGGYNNITGEASTARISRQKFDVIIINGAVAAIDPLWKELLAPGGRMAVVVRNGRDKTGHAVLVMKNANGICGERVLFDAAVPYLEGHQPRKEFVF